MIVCNNHPAREADFHCARCEAAFCQDCTNIKEFHRTKVQVCPQCGNPIVNLAPFREAPSIWTRLPDVLTYPLQNEGHFLLLGWAFFSLIFLGAARVGMKTMTPHGFIGAGGCYSIYYGVLISYVFKIITRMEDGQFKAPDFSEFRGIWQSFVWPTIQYNLLFLIMVWPITAYIVLGLLFYVRGLEQLAIWMGNPLALLLYAVGGLYGLIMFPMGLLLLGVSRSLVPMLNPWFVIQQFLKIPKAYFLTILFIAGFLVVYSLITGFFSIIFPDNSFFWGAVYYAIMGTLQLYMFMVIAYALGYMAFENRFELKWWPATRERKVFMIAGRPMTMEIGRTAPPTGLSMPRSPGAAAASIGSVAVAAGAVAAGGVAVAGAAAATMAGRGSPTTSSTTGGSNMDIDLEVTKQVQDGMAMIDRGRTEEALVLFEELLAANPNNLSALRGITLVRMKMRDVPGTAEAARKQAALMARDKAFEAIWELYSDVLTLDPKFTLLSRDQMLMVRWLLEREMFMEAARALRALAVAYPDDPMAPKALFQCADLLHKKCDKTENAKQLFNYICTKYPGTPFADQAKIILGQINSGG